MLPYHFFFTLGGHTSLRKALSEHLLPITAPVSSLKELDKTLLLVLKAFNQYNSQYRLRSVSKKRLTANIL